MNDFVVTEDILRRFWSKVDKKGEDECWLWKGGLIQAGGKKRRKRNGYGSFSIKGKTCRAHRVSFVIHHGPIPKGLTVLHSCDVKLCVNSKHLASDTDEENRRQAIERGLFKIGEKHHKSVLTEKDVVEIRQAYAQGSISQKRLGELYGLNETSIRDVINRTTWKHIA